jgi:hypothetical protein
VKAVKGVDSRDSKFPVARVISTSPDLIRIEYYATVKQAIAAGLNPRLAKKVFQDIRCNVPVFKANQVSCEQTSRCVGTKNKPLECHVFEFDLPNEEGVDKGTGPVTAGNFVYTCKCVEAVVP